MNLRVIDGMCPLCYESVAGRAHARMSDVVLVCDAPLIGHADFPRDVVTGEPLLLQLPFVNDPWLFGIASVHVMAVQRDRGEAAFDVFEERWPIGACIELEPDPEFALVEHYRPLGLMQMRARCTWRIIDDGLAGFTGYTRDAWRVLVEGDLRRPAQDNKVEAWRRWRLYRDGVEA